MSFPGLSIIGERINPGFARASLNWRAVRSPRVRHC